MKANILFAAAFICAGMLCTSYTSAQKTGYPLPEFSITLINNDSFSNKNIAANKILVLIYFSPTCEHCKDFTKQLTANMKSFKNAQLVMISYQPIDEIMPFEKEFALRKYSNIKVGTERNTFTLLKYFQVQSFPFIAIYNKAGKLAKTIRQEPAVKDIIKAMKE